jgi:glycogen operon protein
LFNAAPDEMTFQLPQDFPCHGFRAVFHSAEPRGLVKETDALLKAGGSFVLGPRSLVLFQHVPMAQS